jgi:hypothetical protein
MENMEHNIDVIIADLKNLLLKKQHDYGPLNISNAPGGPINGLRVRMYDKLARINNLYEKGGDTPNYESIADSFMDLANYAIIGLLVQNGQWEGIPNGNTSAPNSGSERPADTLSRRQECQCSNEVHQMVQAPRIVVRG